MNQYILSKMKSNRGIIEIIIIIFLGYFISQFAFKNHLYTALTIILSLMVVLLFGLLLFNKRAKYVLFDIQFLFLFSPLIFLYVTEIPKMGPLPLSPVFFFQSLYLLYCLMNPLDVFKAFHTEAGKGFLIIISCWFYQYFTAITFANGSFLDMKLVEIAGIFFGLRYFIKNNPERAIWATRILAGILTISMAWFTGEIISGAPSPIRLAIYLRGDEHAFMGSTIDQNGLSPHLFKFGYQIAVLSPLTIIMCFIEKKWHWKIIWIIGGVFSIFALIFAGERSVVFAVGFVLFLFLYKRKHLGLAILIVLMVLISLFISSKVSIRQSIFTRLQSEKGEREAIERMRLQLHGLKIAANNPLGLIFTGTDWEEEALSSDVDFTVWHGNIIAVHNGYLVRVISYGWILGIFVILVFLRLFKTMRTLFSQKVNSEEIKYAQAVALSLISVLIQALFHNSSILSFDPTSVTVLFLFLLWFDVLAVNNPDILISPGKNI